MNEYKLGVSMKVRHLIPFLLFIFPLFLFADIKWLSPSVLKYGKIQEGKTISDNLKFVNTGNKPVEIQSVRPSCGCTVTKLTQNVIAPNDTANIHFSLNTMGFNGMIRKSIHIMLKDRSEDDANFTIQANILRDLDISPRYIYITRLKVSPDTTITRTLTFSNNSKETITISNFFTESDLIKLPLDEFKLAPLTSKDIDIKVIPKRPMHGRQFIAVDTDMPEKPHVNISVYLVIKE